MKTPLLIFPLFGILFCLTLLTSCRHEQVQEFTVDLTYSDGSTDSYKMYAGSLLLVNEGDMHVVAKVVSGDEKEMKLEVMRYTISQDSNKAEHTIRRTGANTYRMLLAKNELLDPAGTVQVKLQSMAMINTGTGPVGACKGNCCEAKCFSTFCCSDPDECRNVPCDCKPPSNCPQPPTGGQTAAQFFELFQSGKETMVFKN